MRHGRLLLAGWLAGALLVPAAPAQPPPPKPGPEHAVFKEREGTWDAAIKAGEGISKGTMVYKLDLGGLWLVSNFKADLGGQPFQGKGLDGYDPARKKYVSIWVDSMSTAPLIFEGSYDKAKSALVMTGEGPGPDGKPTRYRSVTEVKDRDTMVFTLSAGKEGEEAVMMTITYTRKK
jgi:hypothetical protein